MRTINLVQGEKGNFSTSSKPQKTKIENNLLPQINGTSVFKLFRDGKKKETVFKCEDYKGLRIDSQPHSEDSYNIQIQLGDASLAGVLIDASLADYNDVTDPNFPQQLADKIKEALENSLNDNEGHFWNVTEG